jgi:dTMP kinase
MSSKGKLIVLEGSDDDLLGRLSESLHRWMRSLGMQVERTAEPTNGPVGTQIRLYRQGRLAFAPGCLALLLAADRLDHLGRERGMLSWLDDGRHVLCTRYLVSSLVQLYEQVPFDWHRQINAPCRTPDLTLWLDTADSGCYAHVVKTLSDEGQRVCRVSACESVDAVDRQCRSAIARLHSPGGT